MIQAEFISQSGRITGRVPVGAAGLFGLLNDNSASIFEIEDAYASHFNEPARITAHFQTAHLSKSTVSLVILSRPEDLGPSGLARGGYSRLTRVRAAFMTAVFDIAGDVEILGRFDAADLLVAGTGRFIVLYDATAVCLAPPNTTYTGGVLLLNRHHVELVAPLAQGRT